MSPDLPAGEEAKLQNLTEKPRTRAFVIHADLPQWMGARTGQKFPRKDITRSTASCLEEALGLAHALALEIAASRIIKVQSPRPASLFGTGKVKQLKGEIAAVDAELVIINHELTPVQQRNLEKAWDVKVLDRTGLILEIFGERAQTKEGRLQVELAALSYQKSRLVRSWTHLERQRGGLGFVGGPGETQIEADRRMIGARISRLEKELENVKRTRKLHRKSRKKVPYPIIALVGYTNAGKSTLFNTMAASDVMAKDMLFATLDPTMRSVELPGGRKIILSDTVGFISSLPTQLIAAFRATLEEVLEADLILHVRDFSHSESRAQAHDVEQILQELGVENLDERMIEVWNKVDLLEEENRREVLALAAARANVVAISALKGEGLDHLLQVIGDFLDKESTEHSILLNAHQGREIHWLYENCKVLAREDAEDARIRFEVLVPADKLDRFENLPRP